MKLMEVILQDENLEEAIKRVKSNKGVAGVDKMTVDEIDEYFKSNKETIKKQILEKKYRYWKRNIDLNLSNESIFQSRMERKGLWVSQPWWTGSSNKLLHKYYRKFMMIPSVTIVLDFVHIVVHKMPSCVHSIT